MSVAQFVALAVTVYAAVALGIVTAAQWVDRRNRRRAAEAASARAIQAATLPAELARTDAALAQLPALPTLDGGEDHHDHGGWPHTVET